MLLANFLATAALWLVNCLSYYLYNNWELTYVSVWYLLRNGAMYGGEIWHAVARHPCTGPLWGLWSTEVIVVKKINILFNFSNVSKLAVNSFGLWTVSQSAAQTVGCTADGARLPSSREHGAVGLRTFTYSNPLRGQSLRRSTQHDRHGAFNPKPSVSEVSACKEDS